MGKQKQRFEGGRLESIHVGHGDAGYRDKGKHGCGVKVNKVQEKDFGKWRFGIKIIKMSTYFPQVCRKCHHQQC